MSVVPMCLCLTLSDAYVIRLCGTPVKHFFNVMLIRTVDNIRETELTQNHSAGIAALTAAAIQDDWRVLVDIRQFRRHMSCHKFGWRNVDSTIDMTNVVLEWLTSVYNKLLHTIYCIVI